MFKRLIIFTALSLACPALSVAGDIAREVRGSTDNNFFELSLGLGHFEHHRNISFDEDNKDSGLVLGVSWEFHWKGFFTEAIESANTTLNLGYALWENDRWSVDLIAANFSGFSEYDNDIIPGLTEEERDRRLSIRDTSSIEGGVRLTHYLDSSIVQFRVEGDYSNAKAGPIASLILGHAWQVRNWNVYAFSGASWSSRQRNEFLWGITPDEATSRFPVFKARSSVNYLMELGVTRPLSEHWVSRSTITLNRLGRGASSSPLAAQPLAGSIETSISYVF